MAVLTVYDSPEGGGVTFAAASSGGDLIPNDGKTLLVIVATAERIVTATAADTTATVPGFGACTKANAVQTVEINTTDVMGPFPTSAFNNASGQVAITYDNEANLSIAAVRVSGAT